MLVPSAPYGAAACGYRATLVIPEQRPAEGRLLGVLQALPTSGWGIPLRESRVPAGRHRDGHLRSPLGHDHRLGRGAGKQDYLRGFASPVTTTPPGATTIEELVFSGFFCYPLLYSLGIYLGVTP